jgi:hypothetical protein
VPTGGTTQRETASRDRPVATVLCLEADTLPVASRLQNKMKIFRLSEYYVVIIVVVVSISFHGGD